jgi:hypothetical protein
MTEERPIMRDLTEFKHLRSDGADIQGLLEHARELGLSEIERIRVLREVYGWSLVEAKAKLIEVTTGKTLDGHQAELYEAISEAPLSAFWISGIQAA